MTPYTKPLICLSRRNSSGRPVIPAKAGIYSANRPKCAVYGLDSRFRGNDVRKVGWGYALLFVMLAATVLLLSLTAVLPSIYQEGQREREQELIFRGYQYARAIAGFHKKFQRYPTSIDELTKPTNGWRFLRREFPDPMTPSGKWRFIHANAQGVLLDSKTQPPPAGVTGQPGEGQSAGGLGTSGTSGIAASGFGPQAVGGSGFGPQGMGGSGFGQSSGGFSQNSNFAGNTSSGQGTSSFFGGGPQGGGIYIVGVASTSTKQSIRTWNKKTRYDEWEFIGVDLGALGFAVSIPGLPQGVGGQPVQAGQPTTFGPQPAGTPTTPGQNPSMFSPPGGPTSPPQ
jgi:type II secretory pathway pseudopilin PulG